MGINFYTYKKNILRLSGPKTRVVKFKLGRDFIRVSVSDKGKGDTQREN